MGLCRRTLRSGARLSVAPAPTRAPAVPGALNWSPDDTIATGRNLDRGHDDALASLDE
jgi:hypothetical protein